MSLSSQLLVVFSVWMAVVPLAIRADDFCLSDDLLHLMCWEICRAYFHYIIGRIAPDQSERKSIVGRLFDWPRPLQWVHCTQIRRLIQINLDHIHTRRRHPLRNVQQDVQISWHFVFHLVFRSWDCVPSWVDPFLGILRGDVCRDGSLQGCACELMTQWLVQWHTQPLARPSLASHAASPPLFGHIRLRLGASSCCCRCQTLTLWKDKGNLLSGQSEHSTFPVAAKA